MLLYLSRTVVIICFLLNIYGCSDSTPLTVSNNSTKFSGFSIEGISMVAPVKPIDEKALKPIVDVNAGSIALMPYAFCNPESPVIRYNNKGQWWGESDDGVIGCIQLAHKEKLSVMLKPHLWIAHGMYTGAFALGSENEWKLWEDSYMDYMLHFAEIADSLKVEIFCIGTELGASIKARPQFWNTYIDTLKTIFHGKITYAANWDDYKNVPFWQKLDYIGVDAYFPLDDGKTPSKKDLNKGWQKYSDELKKVSTKWNRPILFTEYGYRNVDYAAAEPWKENEGNQNDEAQANALESLYETFAGKKWFAGGFLWKWYIDEGHHRRNKIDFTPQGKAGEKVIKAWHANK